MLGAMPSQRKVALLIETSSRYGRDLMYGVRDWTHTQQPWAIRLAEHVSSGSVPAWIRHWQGDGIIARVDTSGISAALKRTGIPVVDVSDERPRSAFPRVGIDNAGVARLAASHLRQKGFVQVGYCGDPHFVWSRQRSVLFQRDAKSSGLQCHIYAAGRPEDSPSGPDAQIQAIALWLRGLPKPIGIFACYDRRAHQVLEACDLLGLRVPDEVAVLGVDDDELICNLCHPPLSSILPNARSCGYIAAALLSQLMSGGEPKDRVQLIGPIEVIERQSTDAVAIPDRRIADALRYIRAHACEGIRVSDVLKAIPMSRTIFDLKFKRLLGHTARAEILATKLNQARYRLAASSMPVTLIAESCGFENSQYFSVLFRREVGVTPKAYRTRHRTLR
ncbi:MAG: XylR family transcriptional regulator [Steroidobacterales bacterium]